MSTAEDDSDNKNSSEHGKGQFPPVPEDAIVKPEEERPVKMQVRPEENLEEKEARPESADAGWRYGRRWFTGLGILFLGPEV